MKRQTPQEHQVNEAKSKGNEFQKSGSPTELAMVSLKLEQLLSGARQCRILDAARCCYQDSQRNRVCVTQAFTADNNNIVIRVRAREPTVCQKPSWKERETQRSLKFESFTLLTGGDLEVRTTSTRIPVFPRLSRPHRGHPSWFNDWRHYFYQRALCKTI